jgi:hypothetical protein
MIETRKQAQQKAGSLYGTTVKELQEMAIMHLHQWCPKQHKALMASKLLLPLTLKAAERAHREISQLMAAGYQRHEAEEVVLPEYILIKPEEDLIAKIEADEI